MAARPMIEVVPAPLKLNLGCSDALLKGWENVDRCSPADVIANLENQWPWSTSSVEEVKAWDVFEHLASKVQTMNECHRVMKAGARLDLFIPTTDGRGAFQDPTHVSFWTPNDLFYYCDQYPEWERFHRLQPDIFKAHFHAVSVDHREYPNKVWKLRAILECVK